MERDCRGRAANERLSQHRVVPGDPHDAQTSAVRPQSGVWALECALALALRAIFSAPPSAQKLSISCKTYASSSIIQSKAKHIRNQTCSAALRCAALRALGLHAPPHARHLAAQAPPRAEMLCAVVAGHEGRSWQRTRHRWADVPAGSALTNLSATAAASRPR